MIRAIRAARTLSRNDRCGEEIYEGEDYFHDVDGDDLCETCFDKWRKEHCKTAEVES